MIYICTFFGYDESLEMWVCDVLDTRDGKSIRTYDVL
jgi:hypothetical protein